MKLENSFTVPCAPDRAWALLMDIERTASCMPGATLTEVVDDKTYKGDVSVRLGPVAMTFSGVVRFEEIDDGQYRALMKARGMDKKGRGGFDSTINFSVGALDDGSEVLVETDFTLAGAVAQYGRGVGMIKNVAGQIIAKFASNLEAEIQRSEAAPPETSPSTKVPPGRDTPPRADDAKSISGIRLALAAIRDALRRLIGKTS